MELKEDISYNELLQVIKNLPDDRISQLKADLQFLPSKSQPAATNSFQELLLKGPVMSDEQYKTFQENRNHFAKWRAK